MMRHKFTIGVAAFALAIGTVPTFAQERGRPGGGGERTGGTATPREGGESRAGGESRGGGGGAERPSSSGGGMSGGGSMGTSSSPSAPSSSDRSFGAPPTRAPQRARSGGDSDGPTRRAVPRSESGSASGSSSREAVIGGSGGGSGDHVPNRRAVPTYSRPRDGRPASGTAVDRGSIPGVAPPDIYYIYRPYYYPYGFWGSGLGYGLGYLYYDPFWYGSGYGSGYGWGYGGYGGGYGSSAPYYSGGGGYSQSYQDAGALRLKIKPREGQVFVDGYFVGVVDSFDGTFQKLTLDGGGHRVEIKADGFEPLAFDVLITPGETVTYKGEMKRIQ